MADRGPVGPLNLAQVRLQLAGDEAWFARAVGADDPAGLPGRIFTEIPSNTTFVPPSRRRASKKQQKR